MAGIIIDQIKNLRKKTGAGVMDCRRALENSGGDEKKALEWLKKKGIAKAAEKGQREVKSGLVVAYTHGDGDIVAVAEIACETDFVAKNKEFKKLANEICLQVAAMKPKDIDELMKQPYIRDEAKSVKELVTEAIATIGENIKVRRIARFELGEKF
ncbi:MAG TPA: translation elongation factor Ts [Candidatus Bathyarchaeia archaeon]|nr:translation elongation factor Ts [Candidatus Bathyarchaeia archaeon]